MLHTGMSPCRGLSQEPSQHPIYLYVTWIMKKIADFFTIS